MDSKVYVVGDPTTKAVVEQSKNNPDYGYVKVVQSRSMVGADGFYRKMEVPALIHGFTSDLVHAGYYAGQELPGRVVIKESLTPFNVADKVADVVPSYTLLFAEIPVTVKSFASIFAVNVG